MREKGNPVARYLVSIHSPHNYNPFLSEGKAISLTIDQLNNEMKAAGIRIFVGGLHPLSSAKFPAVRHPKKIGTE